MDERSSIVKAHNQTILVDLYDTLFGGQAEVDLLLQMAGDPRGRLIEAGCGTGRLLVAFAEHGWEVVGFDSDPRVLEIARGKMHVSELLAGGIELIQSDNAASRTPKFQSLASGRNRR